MARATKGQWREQYYKENFCRPVEDFLLSQIEKDEERIRGLVEGGGTKEHLTEALDLLKLHAAQASGRSAVFDLASVAMPEDAEAKIPDPRLKAKA